MAEAILAKTGMVPQTRTVNGLTLTDNIAIDDTHINAGNGATSGSLRNILSNCTIHRYGIQYNTDVVNNPNYSYAYETVVPNYVDIGLDHYWWHIKYFRHVHNDGYGAQLAISLDGGNKIYFRTSTGTGWNQWTVIYNSANLNPDTIGAAWANHTHDIVAMGGGRIISGSYTGDATYELGEIKSRFINLGVTPKSVIIFENGTRLHDSNYNNKGGIALQGLNCVIKANNAPFNIIEIVQNGFNVFTTMKTVNVNWTLRINTNENGEVYFYVAFI